MKSNSQLCDKASNSWEHYSLEYLIINHLPYQFTMYSTLVSGATQRNSTFISGLIFVSVNAIEIFVLSSDHVRKWKWKLLSHVRLFATPWTIYIVHGILQARILEWVAFPFSRGSSQHRDWTQVSYIAGGFFTSWAMREVLKAEKLSLINSRPFN